MAQRNDQLETACMLLIDRTQDLSQQVTALINLNAILLREICRTRSDPIEHFATLEAELGGLSEAIAIQVNRIDDVHVSSHVMTDTFERVLRQSRDMLNLPR